MLKWVASPFSRDLPDPGIKLEFPALQADPLPAELPGKPKVQFLQPADLPRQRIEINVFLVFMRL